MPEFSFDTKQAVILGAGGFVGSHLHASLIAQGFHVTCFDRGPGAGIFLEKTDWIVGEFLEMSASLLVTFAGALVFHLMSSCRPSGSTENAADEISLDIATTVRYLEATKHLKMRWVFLSSGGTVYGEPSHDGLLTETDKTDPICSYGVVKLSIENYLQLYKRMHGIDFVIARLANPYGPLQNPTSGQGVIAALIYKAIKGQEIEIWGDGENIRDYIFSTDAANAIVQVARYGVSGEIYNIGSQQGVSINRLIELISSSLNLTVNARWIPARKSDVRSNVLNISKLRKLTGPVDIVEIREGIVKTADWIDLNYPAAG